MRSRVGGRGCSGGEQGRRGLSDATWPVGRIACMQERDRSVGKIKI